jgi:polysaccharide export outer membrane protein
LPQAFISRQVGVSGSVELVPERKHVGSTRRVRVIDLSKALNGNETENIELMPLDHLEVRSRQQATVRPTVRLLGPVKQPGTYELTAGLRVSELIAMAGNVLPEVFYDEAELIRRVYDPERRQLDVRRFRFDLGSALRGAPNGDYVLENGDQVVIRSLRSAQVTVEIGGEVRFPGQYVFPAGATITQLITAAGGMLENADMRAAVFSRESVRIHQQARFDQLAESTRRRYEGALEKLTQNGRAREGLAGRLALTQTSDLLKRMDGYQTVGRIVIPFLREDFPDSPFNLTLEDSDQLLIPRKLETVAVMGHVFNPSTFVAEPGLNVRGLLERAGGLTEFGDERRTYVIRADGNIENLVDRAPTRSKLELYAGDVVLVPREPLRRTFGAKLSDALQLARQAAEAAILMDSLGSGPVDITTVFQPYTTVGVPDYDEAVLGGR